MGRFRTTEKRKPIDASGSYKTIAGDVVEFDGAAEIWPSSWHAAKKHTDGSSNSCFTSS